NDCAARSSSTLNNPGIAAYVAECSHHDPHATVDTVDTAVLPYTLAESLAPFPTPSMPMSAFFYAPPTFLGPCHDVRHAGEKGAIATWTHIVFLRAGCPHPPQNIGAAKVPRRSLNGLSTKEGGSITRQCTRCLLRTCVT